MSLISYDEARPWAKAIKTKVVAREMPPWLADPRYGKFANDRSLTQTDIDTIAGGWMPAPQRAMTRTFRRFRSLPAAGRTASRMSILEMPIEFQLPAEGEIPTLLRCTRRSASPRKSSSTRSSAPEQLRRSCITPPRGRHDPRRREARGRQAGDADGKDLPGRTSGLGAASPMRERAPRSWCPTCRAADAEKYPDGTAKRIPKGWYLGIGMHYQASGKPETDRSRQGLWFAKGPVNARDPQRQPRRRLHRRRQGSDWHGERGARRTIPPIPPYADNWRIAPVEPFTEAVTLYGLSPHMHLRGKDMTYIVTYPGRPRRNHPERAEVRLQLAALLRARDSR